MSEYLVAVDILALHGIRFGDDSGMGNALPSPYVVVKAFGEQRQTDVMSNTSSALLNSYFNFVGRLSAEAFRREVIEVSVYHKKDLLSGLMTMGGDELIGEVVFSASLVFNRRLRERVVIKDDWFLLTNTAKPEDVRGWVSLTLGVYAASDQVPSRLQLGRADDDSDSDDEGGPGEDPFAVKKRNLLGYGLLVVRAGNNVGHKCRSSCRTVTNNMSQFMQDCHK